MVLICLKISESIKILQIASTDLYHVCKSDIEKNSFSYYELNKFCLWASIASSLFRTPNAHPFSRESPPLHEFSNIISEKVRIFNYKHFSHIQNRISYHNPFRKCSLLLHSICFSFM